MPLRARCGPTHLGVGCWWAGRRGNPGVQAGV